MVRRLVAAALLLGSSPLAAEVTETTATGFTVRDEVVVSANLRETWLAMTTPGGWWSDEHTWSGDARNLSITPQAGGCFCERIPGEDGKDGFSLDGSVLHMTVIQSYPLKVLRLRGGLGPLQSEPAEGVLTMMLQEVDGGTRVRWEYIVGGQMRFKPAELAPTVDKVLGQQLARLRDKLGGVALADKPAGAPGEDDSVESKLDALEKN